MERNQSASEQLAQLQRATNATPIVSLPSTANQGVVDLYTQMLGRKPDPEGYAFYDQKFGSNVGPAERAEFSQNAIAERARQPNIAFTPPSVSGARADLNQVQNIIRDQESRRVNETMAAIAASDRPNRSPFAPIPSLSQQVSDENAARDKMIVDTYARAGVNLSTTDLNSMRGQLEQNPTVTNIDPTFLLEERVRQAYKNIGREGNAIDQEGFNFFLNKLKSGEMPLNTFDKDFLKIAADYAGPGASDLLGPINKARTDLEMDPLTAAQVAAAEAAAAAQAQAAAGQGTSTSGGTTASGGITNVGTTSSGGATRQQVLAAYANNPRAVRVPDPEAIEFFMQPGKLANFDAIVEEVRDKNPELAKEIDADRFVSPKESNNPYQQYINPGIATNPRGTQNQDQGIMRFQNTSSQASPLDPPPPDIRAIPPLNPTREQVLAAYAANPKAVRNPTPEAIDFFMQPGNLVNFNTIVDQVRDANPDLARDIDAGLFRDGGLVKN